MAVVVLGCIRGAKLTEVCRLHMCSYISIEQERKKKPEAMAQAVRGDCTPPSPPLPPPRRGGCPHSWATCPPGHWPVLCTHLLLLLTSHGPSSVWDHSIHSQTQGEAARLHRTEQDLLSSCWASVLVFAAGLLGRAVYTQPLQLLFQALRPLPCPYYNKTPWSRHPRPYGALSRGPLSSP